MQSSAAVLFRALVMLACLVAIPLVAVFGRSLPDVIKSLFEGRWPSRPTPARSCLDKFPQSEPMATAGAELTISPRRVSRDWHEELLRAVPPRSGATVDRSAATVAAASYEVPASHQPSPTPGVAADSPQQGPPPVDQFTYIQDRLRQLGATYYLLESWGSRQHLYRFYCKIAIGGNPNSAHYYFEATNSDPLRAMAQVLQQVESWRAGRQ